MVPLTVMVPLFTPAQLVPVALMVPDKFEITLTTTVMVLVHPFASVTVTVWLPPATLVNMLDACGAPPSNT